jgi:hypothetical protein
MPPRLLLFFHYRLLLESSSIDHINYVGWKEVWDAFGYESLTFQQCISEFALKSSQEVMTALCPFTTVAEWAPLLNKRDVRLERDINELCYAEVLPVRGIKDFIIDCSRHATVTVVFLSPFRETTARKILEIAEMNAFVDLVCCYTEREYGLLEAAERLNEKPPKIPSNLNHRWEAEEEARRLAGLPTDDSVAESHQRSIFVSFESDVAGVQAAVTFGVVPVAVGYNRLGTASPNQEGFDSVGDGEDDEEVPRNACSESQLLDVGAAVAIHDFSGLKYEYLQYLKPR